MSGNVVFATRGWWQARTKVEKGIALINQCGTEGINGDGPLSFHNLVKDKAPDYESFVTPQSNFLSMLRKSESLAVASELARAGAQVKAMQIRFEVCPDQNIAPEWEKKAQPFPVVKGELTDYVLDHAFLADEM